METAIVRDWQNKEAIATLGLEGARKGGSGIRSRCSQGYRGFAESHAEEGGRRRSTLLSLSFYCPLFCKCFPLTKANWKRKEREALWEPFFCGTGQEERSRGWKRTSTWPHCNYQKDWDTSAFIKNCQPLFLRLYFISPYPSNSYIIIWKTLVLHSLLASKAPLPSVLPKTGY